MPNLVTRAVQQMLPLFGIGPESWLLYSSCAEALWTLDDERIGQLCGNGRSLVIIWDRTPFAAVAAVNVSKFLTPIDWLVALEVGERWAQAGIDSVRIVDCAREEPGAPARLVRTVGSSARRLFSGGDVDLIGGSDARLLTTLLGSKNSRPSSADDAIRDGIRSIWASALSRGATPDDHHALASIVGPSLLTGEPGDNDSVQAISKLLTAVGLVPSAQTEWQGLCDRMGWIPHGIRLLLVDDLATRGWAQFIKRSLGLDERDSLNVLEDPSDLLEQIPKQARPGDGFRGAEWDRTVLFLDLRLFQETGAEAERAFLRRVVELLKSFTASTYPYLDEADAVLASGDDPRSHGSYGKMLALFPALLAEFDPSLPIVVFSSTRQRTVAQALRNYPNVVLDFEKPSLDQRGTRELIETTRANLQRTGDITRRAMAARSICRSLERNTAKASVAQGAPGSWKAAHIFIDESGDPAHFSVGGICILLPTAGEASITALDQDLAEKHAWGLAKHPRLVSPTDQWPEQARQKVKDPSAPVLMEWMQQVDGVVADHGGAILAFGLREDSRLVPAGSPDALYRLMLKDVLESIATGVLRHLLPSDGEIAVHVATRSSPAWPREPNGLPVRRADGVARYGLASFTLDDKPNRVLFESLDEGDVYSLIDELALRERFGWYPRAARGVKLREFDDSDLQKKREQWSAVPGSEAGKRYARLFRPDDIARRPLQVHYVADFVARCARVNAGGQLNKWFRSGFWSDWKEACECLDVWRLLSKNELVPAVLEFNSFAGDAWHGDSLVRVLREDVARAAVKVERNPQLFRQLIAQLGRDEPKS